MHLLNQYILGLTYSESDIGFVLSAFGGFCLHKDWMKYTLAYSLHFCKLSPFIWGNTSKASGKITKATQLNRKKAWRPCRGYEFQLCKLGSLQRHIPGLCINISPFPGLLKKCKLCINVPNNSTILALQWLYWYTTNLHTYSDSDVTSQRTLLSKHWPTPLRHRPHLPMEPRFVVSAPLLLALSFCTCFGICMILTLALLHTRVFTFGSSSRTKKTNTDKSGGCSLNMQAWIWGVQ